MQKRKMIIPALVLGVATVVGVSSFSNVSANEESQYSPIVQRIAEKFSLNQDDVEQVFEDGREEHRAEMKKNREERLSELVSEGKLTEDQKNALIAKQEENRVKSEERRNEFQNLSREERQAKMKESRETNKAEMEKFAEEQGIDLKELHSEMGEGFGERKGRGNGSGGHGQGRGNNRG